MHDFGYPCTMPTAITIDGLFVDDTNHPDDYTGPYLFTDPDAMATGDNILPLTPDRPFPYRTCRTVTIRALTTASGKPFQVSANAALGSKIEVTNA